MRILDSFRLARACCLREVSRIRAEACHRNKGLRSCALCRVWKSDPAPRCLHAGWHTEGDGRKDEVDVVEGGKARSAAARRPRGTARLGRVARVASLALCAASLLVACSRGPRTAEASPAFVVEGRALFVPADSPLRKRLVVQSVELHEAPHRLSFPATVEADPTHMASVLPALTGRVDKVLVDLGDRVRRGQLLAVVDSGDLAQAYADVYKARDALNLARKTVERTRGVAQAGGASAKDVEAAMSNYVQAQAEYRRAQARLQAVGGTPGGDGMRPMQVRAPLTGTVIALSIAPGVYVNDATVPLMTIANIDKVWVTAQVPEDELGMVAKGQPAEVRVPAYPDRMFHGTVASVSAVLDPDTRRDKVRIPIDNAGLALKPNMYASASVAVAQPPQVFVPQSALLMNNDHTTVFVETAPWTFVRHSVTLSYDEGNTARVLSGLKAGDRVVVAGGVLLND